MKTARQEHPTLGRWIAMIATMCYDMFTISCWLLNSASEWSDTEYTGT